MKYLLLLALSITLICCNMTTKKGQDKVASEETIEITPKGYNTLVPDEEDGGEMFLGKINKTGLASEPFKEWFEENYNGHPLDTARIETIKPLLKDVSIKVFMGTWCEDSQRETPALFKVLEMADFDFGKLEMVAVDHEKQTPQAFEKDLNIEYVPTIIFYKDGLEMNRFVEYANQSLEKDILSILNNEE